MLDAKPASHHFDSKELSHSSSLVNTSLYRLLPKLSLLLSFLLGHDIHIPPSLLLALCGPAPGHCSSSEEIINVTHVAETCWGPARRPRWWASGNRRQ